MSAQIETKNITESITIITIFSIVLICPVAIASIVMGSLSMFVFFTGLVALFWVCSIHSLIEVSRERLRSTGLSLDIVNQANRALQVIINMRLSKISRI